MYDDIIVLVIIILTPIVMTMMTMKRMPKTTTTTTMNANFNPGRFRTAMTEAGFTVAGEEHAICPVSMIMIITMTMITIIMIIMTMIMIMIVWSQVMLWDEQLNQEMAKLMLAEGVLVIPLRFLIYLSRVLPDRVAKCEIFYTDQNLITISQLCFRNESKILKWSNIGPILVQH